VVVWLRNSLILLLFMTKTSDALSKQTKQILGETVVLGEGFEEDVNAEAQAYFLSKRTGNQDDESFFDRVKDFFTPKIEEEPPLETIYVPELKVTPAQPVEIETPTENKIIPKQKPKTKYTQKEIYDMLLEGGFKEDDAKIMSAVAMAESGGDSRALNDDGKKDLSYGLFQINMIGDMGPERRDLYNLNSNNNLYDPMTNIRVTKEIFDKQGYGAWGAYTNNSYKTFLDSPK
jgi:hypothetical protein